MKRLIVITLSALLLALSLAVPVAAADPARPFTATWVAPDGFDFAAPGCPGGAFIRFTTAAHGQVTHLGRTSVAMTHCTWVDPVALTGTFAQGTITLTAANGDSLVLSDHGDFTLVANPDPAGTPPFLSATSTFHWTVTGGTGRFAHAAGSGGGTSLDHMVAGVQEFQLSGSISY